MVAETTGARSSRGIAGECRPQGFRCREPSQKAPATDAEGSSPEDHHYIEIDQFCAIADSPPNTERIGDPNSTCTPFLACLRDRDGPAPVRALPAPIHPSVLHRRIPLRRKRCNQVRNHRRSRESVTQSGGADHALRLAAADGGLTRCLSGRAIHLAPHHL